ncbi:UNVERIFIED_CONTAM: hypothetical protein Sradi_3315700 [Sesamum radiatum]|uniref:Uncharacterized protein n=1 Tax=Sesamum radiatum TaxID=300843 RepID=A0AAW2R1L4_SESRA
MKQPPLDFSTARGSEVSVTTSLAFSFLLNFLPNITFPFPGSSCLCSESLATLNSANRSAAAMAEVCAQGCKPAIKLNSLSSSDISLTSNKRELNSLTNSRTVPVCLRFRRDCFATQLVLQGRNCSFNSFFSTSQVSTLSRLALASSDKRERHHSFASLVRYILVMETFSTSGILVA